MSKKYRARKRNKQTIAAWEIVILIMNSNKLSGNLSDSCWKIISKYLNAARQISTKLNPNMIFQIIKFKEALNNKIKTLLFLRGFDRKAVGSPAAFFVIWQA